MKKICLLSLIFMLFACQKDKIIEIEHKTNGFSSELIATFEIENNGYYFFNSYDMYDHCLEISNGNTKDYYAFDFDNKTYQQINKDEITSNTNNYSTYHTNEKFAILFDTEYKQIDGVSYFNYTYYYQDKEIFKELLSYDVNANGENLLNTYFNEDSNEFYFCLKEKDYISIKKLDGQELIEIKQVDLRVDDYELTDYMKDDNGFVYQYENDNEIMIVRNDNKETISKKVEDYELKAFSMYYEGYLKVYENDTYVKYIMNDDEIIIDKVIDGYQLVTYYTHVDSFLKWYSKDDRVLLMIDDIKIELGQNPKYDIKKDYILASYKENEEEKSIYYDLNTNEKYILSDYIDMNQMYSYQNSYLIYDYSKYNDCPYQFLQFKDKQFEMIELPFDYSVNFEMYLNENQMVFSHEVNNILSIYLVTIHN